MNKFLFGHKFSFLLCMHTRVQGFWLLFICVELSNSFPKWLDYFTFPSEVGDCLNLAMLSPLLSF